MAPDESDEELMRRFQRGEPLAFEALMRRHRTPIHSFLRRQTGDPARAEDLLQETFLRVIRHAPDWTPRALVRTWLYTIARNLAVDDLRRRPFREADPLDAPSAGGASHADRAADPGRAPDEAASDAQLRPLLEAALAALPAEQREVFLLREQAGLSFPEIAEATGVNENTVKSRMRYALVALRDRLAAAGVEAATCRQPGGQAGSQQGKRGAP